MAADRRVMWESQREEELGREKEGSRLERRWAGERGREEEEGGDSEDKGTLHSAPQMLPKGGGRRLGEGYRLGLEFE